MKVAIVGGGISGLAAAYDLQKVEGIEVTLFEKAPQLGGKLKTTREGSYLIEQGPDSIFSAKPWAEDLMRELGMEDELIEPQSREFSILTEGRLYSVPRELATLMPTPEALQKAAFLSPAAKQRALQEAEIGPGNLEEESIGSFFRRRFGQDFSELVAEPLLAGTHAGDPDKLSMSALYPTYSKIEQDYGTFANAAAKRSTSKKVGFLTLREGMATLPLRLAEALSNVRVIPSADVLGLTPGLTLQTTAGDFTADHLILATPANEAAKLLRGIAPGAADGLAAIRFVSTAIVTMAFPRNAFPCPPHGNGFLVPRKEPCAITGCTWSSNKWAARAPADELLMRAFIGRDGGLNVDQFDDETLIGMATDAVAKLLTPSALPLFTRLTRWSQALPQYELGHLTRLAPIEDSLRRLPITLTGSSYRGNSISDSVRQGREAARSLICTVSHS